MKTTKNEFKIQVQNHIIECLSTDQTDVLKEQLENTVAAFEDWYAYQNKKTQGKQMYFIDWLMGLPSEMSVEYTHHGMAVTLREWFENCGAEYKKGKTSEETVYLHLVSREFIKLCTKNGVDFHKFF